MSRLVSLAGAATAASLAFPTAALAQIVEIRHIPPKAGTETDIGTTRILVTGSGENRYDKVATTSLDAWVSVRAPDKPPRDKDKLSGDITVEGHDGARAPNGFSGSSTIYKLTFPYSHPRSTQVANQRISPIEICNDRLNSLSGAAREKFRDEGDTILRHDAYIATARQGWRVRKKNSVFEELKSWTDTVGIPAVIVCHRLTGPKPRDSTSTRGSDARPPARGPDREPPPRAGPPPQRVAPPPTIAKVTLRGEPMNWQPVGGQSCPTQVRLYGFVEVRRAFTGKAIFFGPGFLNPPQDIAFPGAGSRTLFATRNVSWAGGAPGGLAAPGVRPAARTQQVTVRFNIADAGGKVLETAQVVETLTCRVPGALRVRN
ncbi:MAG TPA: hypothetical protein VFZ35_06790 [Sphingomicrobium sp.]